MNEIVIEKLNMNYGKKQVLFDVSMEIKGGIADVNHNVVSVCLY